MSTETVNESPYSPRRLARFVFALPDPLPLADGHRLSGPVRNSVDDPWSADDPWVTVTIRQEQVRSGRMHAFAAAVDGAVRRASDLPQLAQVPENDPSSELEVATTITVIDAMTTEDSPDPVTADLPPAMRPPRSDAFNRCLHYVNDLCRGYRCATMAPYGLPTYERIPSAVLFYLAEGESVKLDQDGFEGEIVGVKGPWSGPSVMMLDHLNLGDPVVGPTIEGELAVRFEHWMDELQYANPLVRWRELVLDARKATQIDGEYAVGVILSLTASEVLLDAVLAMLLWESGRAASDAATVFEEGKVARRLKVAFAPLLGGTWDPTRPGAVGRWFKDAFALRHRIVHGGYQPSLTEATTAMEAVDRLESFMFDAIAHKRNAFPRTTLLTVGEEGLTRRNLWNGKIRDFAEKVAPVEPSWRETFDVWLRQLTAARLARGE